MGLRYNIGRYYTAVYFPLSIRFPEYPEGVIDAIKAAGADVETLDALPMAVEAGTAKAVNVVLIGAMAKNMADVSKEVWLKALRESVPAKFLELNLKAFEMGYNN